MIRFENLSPVQITAPAIGAIALGGAAFLFTNQAPISEQSHKPVVAEYIADPSAHAEQQHDTAVKVGTIAAATLGLLLGARVGNEVAARRRTDSVTYQIIPSETE